MATALITGGTSGIGLTFARRLARDGYDIVLVARDEDRLKETAESIASSTGRHVETLRADLADRDDVERVAQRLSDTERPVDMLVNNAGFGLHVPLVTADVAVHETAMAVMCGAVLVLGAAAARAMTPRGHGTIINVSSTAGFMTMGSYSAMKAWVTTYTESLAVELRGTGVRVNALCPGWVRTEFHQRAGIDTAAIPAWLWTSSDRAVRTCLRDAARGRVISIPTARYRGLMWCARHLPRRVVRAISARITSQRGASEPGSGVIS
ncbi:SDR family NAD(P)-dependent oxidoreductase [Actinobacteria bacterium YIM 96077]|uniref:Short-chain dehydrogenase n=1 Tax=Phytoactinopolyspora halophila TaxID=1981511 RepID=A0A329QE61_9ACTN|nr:SDR family NAD(P)-dependent oxidoreductase [Phytoactinopolyspora halophila]AYY13581.1 SDR family NAD(P)-dependent oxidoreductase [Actinobacteria bacterium YIM 96077]RAW10753.1 short-chain dehydrogenase [Phytoactinopolyspora halophila]